MTIGFVLILFSFCWSFFHLKLLYDYHFTAKLFIIMLPDWILTLNSFAGFIGVLDSILVFKNKINPYLAISISSILFMGFGSLEFYLTL